jgi:hypothetical protein
LLDDLGGPVVDDRPAGSNRKILCMSSAPP